MNPVTFATRARKAIDEAGTDRIGTDREHDQSRSRKSGQDES